ncbi:MAG: type II toxin-antitoxin system HicA family toxin [Acidobacteriota bacterium]
MASCKALLEKAKNKPKNLRFDELCALANCFGYQYRRTKGSHEIYTKPGKNPMNFQNEKGNAKPYQVRQLLDAIEESNHE